MKESYIYNKFGYIGVIKLLFCYEYNLFFMRIKIKNLRIMFLNSEVLLEST